MLNIKKLITALNSIDDPKRLQIIAVTDKPDNDLYDDDLADYQNMLASKHGDFAAINSEES